jgi:putative phosphoribosyl transferase
VGTCRILSRSSEPFQDRVQAGRLLARELARSSGRDALVLGIPRGGLVVAEQVAEALEGDLDVVLSRKLGAPGNPELAVGAVTEDGRLFLHEESLRQTGAGRDYIEREKARQMEEIARRAGPYRQVRPKVPLAGRRVIVTDDGVATGATMLAALRAARAEGPAELVVAIPVGPDDSVCRLADEADQAICLRSPFVFGAIGRFYVEFSQVDDAEVLGILSRAAQRRGTGG